MNVRSVTEQKHTKQGGLLEVSSLTHRFFVGRLPICHDSATGAHCGLLFDFFLACDSIVVAVWIFVIFVKRRASSLNLRSLLKILSCLFELVFS